MEKDWADHINSETARLTRTQQRVDEMEARDARGLSEHEIDQIKRNMTDPLHRRIAASEETLALMGARIAELESLLGLGNHKGLRIGVMDSGHHEAGATR